MRVIRDAAVALALVLGAMSSMAAEACSNRGDLDANYCDENKDLVADTPKDAKRLKSPNTIVFTYTPVEDPAVYEKIFKPFTDHLAQCMAKRVVFYQVQSNAAEIEAMRSGRLHVGGFSTGPTAFAVNIAGAIPFAVKGTEKEFQGYNLIVVVKASSPYQKLADLKAKGVLVFAVFLTNDPVDPGLINICRSTGGEPGDRPEKDRGERRPAAEAPERDAPREPFEQEEQQQGRDHQVPGDLQHRRAPTSVRRCAAARPTSIGSRKVRSRR